MARLSAKRAADMFFGRQLTRPNFREPGKWLNDSRGYKMHDWQIKEKFGLESKTKWPDVGLSERLIGNVYVWVRAKSHDKSRKHRAMAQCPGCKGVFTHGKIHIHFRACELCV